ncbi:MAG TPA: ATP-grasp domain-containing protein [Thermoproteota archaeon]|nr:ATP-grasp domain-containing protein [Thermoproteota archaeon]
MRFCILTHNPGSHFVVRVAESFRKHGHEVRVMDFARLTLSIRDGLVHVGWGGEFQDIADSFDACLARPLRRRDLPTLLFSLNALSALSKRGLPVINDPTAYIVAASKLGQYLELSGLGLPVPDTASSLDPVSLLSSMARGTSLIEKPICGSRGSGVRRVHVGDEKYNQPETVSLYQRDLSGMSFDIRVFTVGYESIAAMKRISSCLAANVSRGGRPERIDLSEELADIAQRASKATGAEVAGTDIVIDRGGKPYILEVNAQPDFIGLETVTDVDIPSKISEYVVRRAEERRIA